MFHRVVWAKERELIDALRRLGVFPYEATNAELMDLGIGTLRQHALDYWENKRRSAFDAAQRQTSLPQSSATLNQGY